MRQEAEVAVVIPTLNAGTGLAALLDALDGQEGPFRPRILAIDSGSTDRTVALLTRRAATVLRVSAGAFNHGETRNQALRAVGTEFAVLMVQDALPVSTRWLQALVRPLSEDASLAGTWARQQPHDEAGRITRHYHSQWIGSASAPRIAGPLTADGLASLSPADRHAVCAFDNVCSCIRMSVWRDHPFPAAPFGEDIEWAAIVLRAGHRLAFVPDAVVRHSHERPLTYELRRTRLAHARLHRLFGLSTVPSFAALARSIAVSVPLHVGLAAQEPRGRRARAMARAVGLAVAWPLGQYLGARDSRAGRIPESVKGV